MFNSDKNIYLQETEVRPNHYASYALLFSLVGIIFCWVLNEIGLFRVGTLEMRLGSSISFFVVLVPLIMLKSKRGLTSKPTMKYVVIVSASVFTMTVATLLTFHTTIMLLFPIFIAMLYRSKVLGRIAFFCSVVCTVVSPILGYWLDTWDIELFKELILIGTNGTAVIEGAYPGISLVSVLKILLYLVLPRLIMVGSCSLLMFYVIRVGVSHVDNQILLNNLSRRDVLTGLFNRNYFSDIQSDASFSGDCAVIFFDVNGLKQVNDRLGHEAGDMMLCKCADCLRRFCDEEKSAAFRIGGDEFVMLLFGIDEAEIRTTLTMLEYALKTESETREFKQYGIRCSMAAGYAMGNFTDSENLLRIADANMYERKKSGQNSYLVF